MAGCGSGSGTTASKAVLPAAVSKALTAGTAVDPLIVTADNGFGFSLLNQLSSPANSATNNVFISPTSVALALQMTANGANGNTLTAMTQAMQLGSLTPVAVDTDNAALQASLVNPDPNVALTIANSVWVHTNTTTVLPAFLQTNQNYYGAQVGDLGGAPDNINAWVSNATNKLIPTLVTAQDVQGAVAVIVNAIYFKGQWTIPFDPAQTTSATFNLSNGTTAPCKLMNQSGSYLYYAGANYQAVQLPYGKQGRLNMTILLPNTGVDISTITGSLTAASWSTLQTQFTSAQGTVGLPRFISQYKTSLNAPLTALGMGIAFTSGADFSNLAPGTQINGVIHATYLAVDEQGTTAAGATGVVVGTSVSASPPFTMTMNRPFFCAIQDTKTGEILFMGTINNPGTGS